MLESEIDHPMVLFSSETGLGKDELWGIIKAHTKATIQDDESPYEDSVESSPGSAHEL